MIRRLKSLKLFDITLRSGLPQLIHIYSNDTQIKIMNNIITNIRPSAIDVGFIIPPKNLSKHNQYTNINSSFNNINLSKYNQHTNINSSFNNLILSKHNQRTNINSSFNNLILSKPNVDLYMLTPTLKSLEIAYNYDIKNYSFITSVSNNFQKNYWRQNLDETKIEIDNMMDRVIMIPNAKVKLYISCITDCPINGNIENNKIINEILYYYYVYDNIDEICLSDTCGTISFKNFKLILDELIRRNIDLNKISLHLQLHNQENERNIKNIIIYAMKNGIYKYDVSQTSNTGNLSYDFIISCL
jgi:hypothetical protein